MQRILLALVITFLAKIGVADEISVTEFVSGTTISSSDMNQNFQTLVDESNENDERIKGLENTAAAVSPVPTWIDGQGREIGRWNGQNNPWGIIPILDDTDLVFPPFATVSSNGISYPDNGQLWYNSSRCDTPPPERSTQQAMIGDQALSFSSLPVGSLPMHLQLRVEILGGLVRTPTGLPMDLNVSAGIVI